MSGGAFDYAYYKIEDIAKLTSDPEIRDLMLDLAELYHDEEWYRSGDTGRSDWLESLNRFKEKWFKTSREERLVPVIDERIAEVKRELVAMIGERTCHIIKQWRDSDYVKDWRYLCSECGGFIPVDERDPETGDVISAANYCPDCGAKVVEECLT